MLRNQVLLFYFCLVPIYKKETCNTFVMQAYSLEGSENPGLMFVLKLLSNN